MQQVSDRWYRGLNLAALAVSFLMISGYILGDIFQKQAAINNFGLSKTTLVLSVIHLLFGLIYFPLIRKYYSGWSAGITPWIIFSLSILVTIELSGEFSSPYIALWLIIVILSGAFGSIGLFVINSLFSLYVVMSLLNSNLSFQDLYSKPLLILTGSYLVGALSYVLWLNYYQVKEDAHKKDLSSKLEGAKLKAEKLIQSITDGVVVLNENGNIDFINQAAQAMSGWSEKDATGIDYRSVFTFTDPTGQALAEEANPFTQVIVSNQPVTNGDLILNRKDSTSIELSVAVSPVSEQDGKKHGAIGVLRDVSKEKEQQRQQVEFISTASHEMRTPVASIEGYLSLALNPKISQIDEKTKSYLEKASAATEHLGKLFRDLLTASKSEDGRLENHPLPVEINGFLKSLIDDLRFTTDKKGLSLNFTLGGQPEGKMSPIYYVFADPERLREVIINLTDNAIKFTEKGGITIDLRGDKDAVQISLTDTGIGIPASDVGHLFQKFYRIDNTATRTIGGTGLGLFICKQIIEYYKGRIWVESTQGKGSSFYIQLPRLEQERAESIIKQQQETTAEQDLSPGKIVTSTEAETAHQQASDVSDNPVVEQPEAK